MYSYVYVHTYVVNQLVKGKLLSMFSYTYIHTNVAITFHDHFYNITSVCIYYVYMDRKHTPVWIQIPHTCIGIMSYVPSLCVSCIMYVLRHVMSCE